MIAKLIPALAAALNLCWLSGACLGGTLPEAESSVLLERAAKTRKAMEQGDVPTSLAMTHPSIHRVLSKADYERITKEAIEKLLCSA